VTTLRTAIHFLLFFALLCDLIFLVTLYNGSCGCACEDGLGITVSGDVDFSSTPTLLAVDSTDFQQRENFLRGCLWLVYGWFKEIF